MEHATRLARRSVVGGVLTGIAAGVLPWRGALAQEKVTPEAWQEALKAIVGTTVPPADKIVLDVPEIAENGNTVPVTITVDSPMTDKDYVRALHLIATGNPLPGIASFELTPLSGKATVASRIRLAKTQDVIAIAELSSGGFLMARKNVKVTIGGCGA